ncbi:ead/Ea22-like family protein [Pseudoalteromonas spongiae]|uniref:ead/Ea22-like family protein n=1 Tax=Pseudoalteromonas spongiae TaxID=298657 RepID=UPI0018E21CF5|nr:ead/Ea22-like family protein [Pseudoalteromonas spongiae]
MENIPAFLFEMSKQINEQDNRLTADPLFEVRYKDYLVTEEGYQESHWEVLCDSGHTLYHSERSENFDDLASYLFQNESDWCESWLEDKEYENVAVHELQFTDLFNKHFDTEFDELPSEIKKLHMQEVEVTVNSHFTEADAQAFIDRKQHDYPKLYIYAISLCYCENMAKLRNWIKDLSTDSNN